MAPAKASKARGQKAGPVACPRCKAAVPVRGRTGTCGSCGLAVDFLEVPDRPCAACGGPVPVVPGAEVLRCAACGHAQPADPARPLVGEARCPRCRRTLRVDAQAPQATCPHCAARMTLADAF